MMTAADAIQIACNLTSGCIDEHYMRVNDYIVDTFELQVVAMIWPRMERGAFPIHNIGETIEAAL